ncbi:MAG: hypothetical protein ABIQ66_04225 [Novosphingobium sp.]
MADDPSSSPVQAAALQDALTPLARLALAYAPAKCRNDWLTVLALDARLAAVIRQSREPVLGQIRLAWWREKLEALSAGNPPAEPLLARIAMLGGGVEAREGLISLVNGWESLLGESPLNQEVFNQFANGRAQAMVWLAVRHGADVGLTKALARRWALADLALHLGDPAERAVVQVLWQALPPPSGSAGRVVRPLAILEAVSARALARSDPAALTSPAALGIALRIGLLGR